ncbi:IclR family pca regulon transcriptional regulator [Spinactinospora alkalitolerans]|uniref:Glycerol operon regulatory protein n=1 Tax=Spinactinospora alkalitolerans TaxID=687207 RepID=A0A852TVZ9_9ACTN|nr:IclR family transcriptional regulator C-terminal domain-containing protein [Spinactinospora alkalitolerans]NYE47901.1 IclR family pca regulon transcriptional regulator [Spinactinospora alkalitolerans]
MPNTDRDFIQSIERGFAVLIAFDERNPNPTLAEIAAETGLSRPAVRRILLTLQRLGYVNGVDGRWSLTPRVLSIGQHFSATHALTEAAQPHLLRIAEETGESASLGVLDGTEVVYAARVPVRRIMSINVSVGTRVPAYATSMGRALLAWSPEDRVSWVIENSRFERLGPATVTDPDELRAELADIRRRGYAITSEELERGLISLAVPVRDATGGAVGVLASSTSTGRSTLDEFRTEVEPLLTRAARRLSIDMGFREVPRS